MELSNWLCFGQLSLSVAGGGQGSVGPLGRQSSQFFNNPLQFAEIYSQDSLLLFW